MRTKMMMVTEGAYAYSEAFLHLLFKKLFWWWQQISMAMLTYRIFIPLWSWFFPFLALFTSRPWCHQKRLLFLVCFLSPHLVISRPDKGRVLCCICLIFLYPSSMALQSFLIFSFLTNSLSWASSSSCLIERWNWKVDERMGFSLIWLG